MSLFKRVLNLITYHEKKGPEPFTLSKYKEADGAKEQAKPESLDGGDRKQKFKRPVPVSALKTGAGYGEQDRGLVSRDLSINRKRIEELYHLPLSKDFVVRDFVIALKPPVEAFAVFMEGMADKNIINNAVLEPLMLWANMHDDRKDKNLLDLIKERILPGNQVDIYSDFQPVLEKINYGGTAIFVEGCEAALVVETKGWEHRAVGAPTIEQVVRGPHEAFVETLRVNTALIRKQLQTEDLVTEMTKVGLRSKVDVAVMYLRDVANPELVAEVRRRLTGLKVDHLADSGVLEQLIEDHPFMPAPQVLATERPDRVVSMLAEGRVAVLANGNPFVLVVPVTFFTLLHSPEDIYLRWPYGSVLRLTRLLSFFIALFLPGLYLAMFYHHQEMVPTELILAIAGARERVPFPTIVELILMEFSFELIREAGVRVPGVIGVTIGIIGALILGQAAVSAGIVSPILIIIVAVTGLANFSIPNFSLAFTVRLLRFVFIFLGTAFGFLGISAGFYLFLLMLTGMRSFGVSFLASAGQGRSVLLRKPVWEQELRPDFLQPLNKRSQPGISRNWVIQEESQEGGAGDKQR